MTDKIIPSTSYKMNDKFKAKVEKMGFSYYDFDYEKIKTVAATTLDKMSYRKINIIVQAIYPEYAICSGLFDSFLIMSSRDNVEICFRNLDSGIDNRKENITLFELIMNYLKHHQIETSSCWNSQLKKIKNAARGDD